MSREPVSVVVFAKRGTDGELERGAQYDLLCRSLAHNWPEARLAATVDANAGVEFQAATVRALIEECGELVCFATDDGVFYRRVNDALARSWRTMADVLGLSLRLGFNTTLCYPSGMPQAPPDILYRWQGADGDFGYPGSLDGTVYRRTDVLELLRPHSAPNPTALEAHFSARCELHAEQFPHLMHDRHSSYVCVPVNRVSEQSNVRAGESFPQGIDTLREAYDAGERISLERTFAGVEIDSCHQELPFRWRSAPTPAGV